MAVTALQEKLAHLVAQELNSARRYRCLVLQTADLRLMAYLVEQATSLLTTSERGATVLPWEMFFDQVGALSSEDVRTHVLAPGRSNTVLLAGPLHYVDYWTGGVQDGFWNFMSLYSHGPGVVLFDTPRSEGVEGPFIPRGTIAGTDIRYLRPRLVATE
jgi:hypothetical protein